MFWKHLWIFFFCNEKYAILQNRWQAFISAEFSQWKFRWHFNWDIAVKPLRSSRGNHGIFTVPLTCYALRLNNLHNYFSMRRIQWRSFEERRISDEYQSFRRRKHMIITFLRKILNAAARMIARYIKQRDIKDDIRERSHVHIACRLRP